MTAKHVTIDTAQEYVLVRDAMLETAERVVHTLRAYYTLPPRYTLDEKTKREVSAMREATQRLSDLIGLINDASY